MGENSQVLPALDYLTECKLDRNEWLEIGIDLYHAGYSFEVYNEFCKHDPKGNYNETKARKNWETFADKTPNENPGGYIVDLATRYGFAPICEGRAIDWGEDYECSAPIGDTRTPSAQPIGHTPTPKKPQQPHFLGALEHVELVNSRPEDEATRDQVIAYLETMFSPSEWVCIAPTAKSSNQYKVAQLFDTLKNEAANDHTASAMFGTEGAYICINPTNGEGRKNSDITALRYALIECDSMPKGEQLERVLSLRLPCSAIVDSGNKSIHALVRIDAQCEAEYKERVDFLHQVCKDNGFIPDDNCKNQARLSRLPGCTRTLSDGTTALQRLIALQNGCSSWDEWAQWVRAKEAEQIKEPKKNEPCIEWAYDYTGEFTPKLPDYYIKTLLYPGCKMSIVAGAKTGKTWLGLGMAVSLAAGKNWLGFDCKKLRVLYVNIELQNAFFKNRVEDVRSALNVERKAYETTLASITLRGKATSLDDVYSFIGGCKFDVIILDPIGKLIEGDENKNADVNQFLAKMDALFVDDTTSVIYIHHTGKGSQAGKTTGERARGASAFFGDVDTALEFIELVPNTSGAQEYIKRCTKWNGKKWIRPRPFRLKIASRNDYIPEDVNVWFEHPIYVLDTTEELRDCYEADTNKGNGSNGGQATASKRQTTDCERIKLVKDAILTCKNSGEPPTKERIYELFVDGCKKNGVKCFGLGRFQNLLSPGEVTFPFVLSDGEVVCTDSDIDS